MRTRASRLAATITLALFGPAILTTGAAAAQEQAATPADWTPPRTAWAAPDLQGIWDYRTLTPLERPAQFDGREFLTAEEIADLRVRLPRG